MIQILKKTIIALVTITCAMLIIYVFQNELNKARYSALSFFPSYKKDKELVSKYFDKEFYLKTYAEELKNSNLQPIDHFLQRDWYSTDWKDHKDPNPWFNTTLYKDRLWGDGPTTSGKSFFSIFPMQVNPFVDFLKQSKVANQAQTVEVWTKEDEVGRAWLAVEGLLRLNRFNVKLHVTSSTKASDLIRFNPQIERGLKVINDNHKEKSFYQSDFIRNPDNYRLPSLELKPQAKFTNSVNNDQVIYVKAKFSYLVNYLYNYTNWPRTGRINPTMINIGHYCSEPISGPFLKMKKVDRVRVIIRNLFTDNSKDSNQTRDKEDQSYLVRISDGFDLMLLGTKLPIKNMKIVPGFMQTWIDEKELNDNKEFSVSFLLTQWIEDAGLRNYSLRKKIWDNEEKFTVPTKFYLSYRDKGHFASNLQNRVMPTDSKKWIFNSQFSIAVENCRQEYYFTEKLLGCFVSLTVPIYIGCTNILDYFDSRGMIIVTSLDELIKTVNSLTPETYEKMLPYLKENKRRTLEFLHLEERIIDEFGKKVLGGS